MNLILLLNQIKLINDIDFKNLLVMFYLKPQYRFQNLLDREYVNFKAEIKYLLSHQQGSKL